MQGEILKLYKLLPGSWVNRVMLLILSMYGVATIGCSASNDANVAAPMPPAADEPASLHNLLKLSGDIFCGGEPHNQEAFAQLAALGVKTVVSVDGAQPDIAAAREHGLRYVHIPIGYDGVDEQAGLSFARLVRDAEGPFYIHCHHGRHRGPAAAAIACIAAGDMDHEAAVAILEKAGTSKDYAGLWRAVESYQSPPNDAELPALVEVAEIESFAVAMASLDRAFDNLKLCREADWATPSDHPDLVPSQQALLVKEALRESGRNLSEEFDPPLKTWLAESKQAAQHLEQALAANDRATAEQHFQMLAQSCTRCHERYRN